MDRTGERLRQDMELTMAFLLQCLRAARSMSGQLDLLPPSASSDFHAAGRFLPGWSGLNGNSTRFAECGCCAVHACHAIRSGRGIHCPTAFPRASNPASPAAGSADEPEQVHRSIGFVEG